MLRADDEAGKNTQSDINSHSRGAVGSGVIWHRFPPSCSLSQLGQFFPRMALVHLCVCACGWPFDIKSVLAVLTRACPSLQKGPNRAPTLAPAAHTSRALSVERVPVDASMDAETATESCKFKLIYFNPPSTL